MSLVKYIGKQYIKCQMCHKHAAQAYIYNAQLYNKLFPEVDLKPKTICENCAKREAGKKHWSNIRRIK